MPQITGAIKSQGRRDGKQSGYLAERLSVFGNVARRPQFGISHSLNMMSGRSASGHEVKLWYRQTLSFRKVNGAWKIAHEHSSVPFYMDGSFRAATDLKP